MNKSNLLILGLIVLAILAGITIYMQQETTTELVLHKTPIPSVTTTAEKLPIIHYPVAETTNKVEAPPTETQPSAKETVKLSLPKVLPEIQNSDASIQEQLIRLEPKGLFTQLLVLDNFISRFVVTIDNLPGKKLPQAHLPLKPPKGRFLISGTAEEPQTSSRNHKRYEPYVNLMESFAPELTIKVYKHFYPLFQSAYKQLGYRNAYFNDRLIQVLNHLLETPTPTEPMALSQPLILYTFTDPTLEKLSSGQKILLRMGPKNHQRMLKIIAAYRQQLVGQP